jgi:hypothetical protein
MLLYKSQHQGFTKKHGLTARITYFYEEIYPTRGISPNHLFNHLAIITYYKKLMKQIIFIIVCFSTLIHGTIAAQCPQEKPLIEKYKQMAASAESWDIATPAGLCRKYYTLVCEANQDTFEVEGTILKRTEQAARMIEDDIRRTIEAYNKESNQLCGPMNPVTAVFSESIGVKEAPVVGYWVAKDEYYGRTYYPELSFFNGGNFKTSVTSNLLQRSSWKKISDYEYEITVSEYSKIDETYSNPRKGLFLIDPGTNTATYSFTKSNGQSGTSRWFYKGKSYSTFGLDEMAILRPVSVDIK